MFAEYWSFESLQYKAVLSYLRESAGLSQFSDSSELENWHHSRREGNAGAISKMNTVHGKGSPLSVASVTGLN